MLQQLYRCWCNLLVLLELQPIIYDPIILFIHQFFYVLLSLIFNPFIVHNCFTQYYFQTVWPHYILRFRWTCPKLANTEKFITQIFTFWGGNPCSKTFLSTSQPLSKGIVTEGHCPSVNMAKWELGQSTQFLNPLFSKMSCQIFLNIWWSKEHRNIYQFANFEEKCFQGKILNQNFENFVGGPWPPNRK